MRKAFEELRVAMADAAVAQLSGNVEPYLEFWSQKPDIFIFGGLGGYERGWPVVADRLRWAATRVHARLSSIETLTSTIEGTMAITAELQHMVRFVDGKGIERTLRVTHGYRVEGGQWRIFYRHGDEYKPSGR